MRKLARTKWIVYAKKPFRRVDHVLKYLGRYTHRVGISNSRLVEVLPDAVTFSTKNGETVTLSPAEFLRRFVQHVLPDGFHKIRHYGLYAGAADAAHHAARTHLEPTTLPDKKGGDVIVAVAWPERLRDLTGRDVEICPRCGGHIEHRPVPAAICRAPPRPECAA